MLGRRSIATGLRQPGGDVAGRAVDGTSRVSGDNKWTANALEMSWHSAWRVPLGHMTRGAFAAETRTRLDSTGALA